MTTSRRTIPVHGLLATALLSATLIPAAPATAADLPPNGPRIEVTQTIYPVIDTDVVGISTVPRHWLPSLEVANAGSQDHPDSRSAYLRFDVKSGIPGTITGANLKLTAQEPSTSVSNSSFTTGFVEDDSWVPTRERAEQPQFEMTGASKLPSTDIPGTTSPLTTEGGSSIYSAPVEDVAVTERAGDGLLSLRVTMNEADPNALASFFADEGGVEQQRPRLEITTVLTDPKDIANFKRAERDLAAARSLLHKHHTSTTDLPLHTKGLSEEAVKWSSWDSDVLTDQGEVTRPQKQIGDASVKFDFSTSRGSVTLRDRFNVTVSALEDATTPPATSAAIEPIALEPTVTSLITEKWNNEFNHVSYPKQILNREVEVRPGESIQAAIDGLATGGGGVVRLTEGIHTVTSKINLKNFTTLVGAGKEHTQILYKGTGAAIGTAQRIVTDVVIKDLTLSGLRGTPNLSTGVLLEGIDPVASRHNRIALQNLSVKNFTIHGVHMKRASNIIMSDSTVHHNGEANGLYHNVYWLFDNNILQSDVDMSNPVRGKGAKYTSTSNVIVQRAEIRDSTVNGVQADGSNDDKILLHKFDITGSGKTALWFIAEIFHNPNQYTEDPAFAPRQVIISESRIVDNKRGGVWKIASDVHVVNSVFANKDSDLLLLKSQPTFENTSFRHPPQYFTDPTQVPLF